MYLVMCIYLCRYMYMYVWMHVAWLSEVGFGYLPQLLSTVLHVHTCTYLEYKGQTYSLSFSPTIWIMWLKSSH